MIQQVKLDGSGIILFIDEMETKKLKVILSVNKRKTGNVLQDFGGILIPTKLPEDNAKKELFEETNAVFQCKATLSNYNSITIGNRYKCYPIFFAMRQEDIEKIDEMFKSNRGKTDKSLKCYFETLRIIIIDWDDLMGQMKEQKEKSQKYYKDPKGNIYELHKRCKEVIHQLIIQGEVTKAGQVQIKRSRVCNEILGISNMKDKLYSLNMQPIFRIYDMDAF